jgi:hypothetical protein
MKKGTLRVSGRVVLDQLDVDEQRVGPMGDGVELICGKIILPMGCQLKERAWFLLTLPNDDHSSSASIVIVKTVDDSADPNPVAYFAGTVNRP